MIWLLPLLGFLLGSIPFGLLMGKLRGIDIREHGSGNIGATNVFRTLGKGNGIVCLLLDFLKGMIPVIIASNLCKVDGQGIPITIGILREWNFGLTSDQLLLAQIVPVVTAFAAIMGHNYSPWIGFKGGKGVATTGGAFTALMPFGIPILILIWAIFTFTTKYVSVGSIAAGVALPFMALLGSWKHGKLATGEWNKPLFVLALVSGLLAIWKHRANIARLRAGTENKIGSKKKS